MMTLSVVYRKAVFLCVLLLFNVGVIIGQIENKWSVSYDADALELEQVAISSDEIELQHAYKLAPLNVSCFQQSVFCNGGATGSATALVSGGTPPYSYIWTDGQSTLTATGLSAGSVTVIVSDSGGESMGCSVTILEPTPLTSTSLMRNVSCFGASNAAAYVAPAGGIAPYGFLWDDGTTTQKNAGLNAGIYSVTITDANNCTLQTSVTIQQPPQLLAFATLQSPVCNGSNTASVDLTVMGGVPPYSYTWSNGASTEDVGNLLAGFYFVLIKDAKGCATFLIAIIQEPGKVVVQSTAQNVLCNGQSNGVAFANVTGGITPYSYLWSNGQTSFKDTLLSAGAYSVIVTDNNGCTDVDSVTINEPLPLSCAIIVQNPVSCNGANDGELSVSILGGTAPYTSVWSTNPLNFDTLASNLSAGTYTVQVIDANGCVTFCSYTLSEPQAVICSATASVLLCNGDGNGTASVIASGGSGALNYLWSTGATISNISGLSAGNYSVIVSDNSGCTTICSVAVLEPTQISVSYNVTNAICANSNTGSAMALIAGGSPPYNYLWSDGQTGQTAVGLSAGVYSVAVTDNNSCLLIGANITISQSSSVQLSALAATDVTCFGGTDGTASVGAIIGGTAPYLYSWNTTPLQFTQTVTGLSAGTYIVTVTDVNGCTGTDSATVSEPLSAVNIDSVAIVAIPCNGGVATATVYASGGVSPYTYLWSDGQTSQTAIGLSNGFVLATVTDGLGCAAQANIFIADPSNLYLTLSTTSDICNGSSSGTVSVDSISGGTGPYSYLWSNGATTQNVTGLIAGSYTLTVTDDNGCSIQSSATVSQASTIIGAAFENDVTCNGGNDGDAVVFAIGGNPPYNFSWSDGQSTQMATNLIAGSYIIVVSDQGGCLFIDSVVVSEPTVLVGSIAFTDPLCFANNNGTASVTVSGGTSPYFYNWSNGQNTNIISNLLAGVHTVTVSDFNGCALAPMTVTLTDPAQLIIDSITTTNTTVVGGSDGTASVFVSGGTGSYSYSWSTSPIQTTMMAVNLSAGSYVLTVTDANACTSAAVAIVGDGISPRFVNGKIEQKVVLYPNPNNGIFSIQVSRGYDGKMLIQVLDLNGKIVQEKEVYVSSDKLVTFNLSHLRKGIYWLRLKNDLVSELSKVIVE